ncbi:heavy metal sensor signal transduction histidine kinase [Acidovorax sp. KKS102]|uniref:heavy metal sensor histidine kinase n=1 Tax=Acidovorax sp. KKS102 TaxID=358220 RepID=UPI00028B27A2|nr:heavy metal sensor histidine kinase [Acidovorax sp. KKS102]AFU44938.1 heavy metal sensor signal transduction histidine kinase [Acidovorax sp. KKS102]
MIARYSLTTRLTVFFTLASGLVLVGLGTLVAISIDRHFVELDRDALRDKIHLTREVIGKSTSPQDLKIRLDDVLHSHEGLFVSVFRDKDPLYATTGFQFPQDLIAQTQKARLGVASWQTNDREYRGMSESVSMPGASQAPLQIWVALDIAHHKHFMQGLIRVLVGYVALATLVAGILGWWAAKNGLAPLRTMRSRAMAITAQRLDDRMPTQEFPVEMADLATTLNEMLRRLKEEFDRLSEFSSDLAHELRTPINNLMTQTQVTLSQARSPHEYRNILASNAEEYQRLARMVADMLFLAKADHGLILPSTEKIAVHDETRALYDFYEALAEEKQVRLELVGQAEVWGDRLMLRRALSNLLSNAIRYTPAGERVVIDVMGNAHGTTVNVLNAGPPIDEQMIPRLFDRFFRADKSRKQLDSDGAGLGLSITQAIVHAHGGSMSVSSVDGMTCFSMYFPSAQNIGKRLTTDA